MDTGDAAHRASPDTSPGSEGGIPTALDHKDHRWLRLAQAVVLIGSLCIVAIGLAAGSIGVLAGLLAPSGDMLPFITVGMAFLALCLTLGAAMGWQAYQALLGRDSSLFVPRRVRLLIALYGLAVLAGHLVLSRDLLTPLTFPPLHVAATVLPPLTVLWLVGGALRARTRWRDIDLQLGSGAFLSTGLAFLLELVVVVSVLISVLAVLMLIPSGLDHLQAFLDHMRDPAWLQDPSGWEPLARSPLVVALALLIAAVAVPMIEEAVKTVGVGLASYRRPELAEAFLWGLAGGVGFSLAEGMLNTTSDLESWAAIVLLRVGATMLHCVTGGLMGIAWFALLAHRNWLRALAIYIASVAFHGTWNALTVGVALSAVWSPSASPQGSSTRLTDTSSALFLSLLLALGLVASFGLVGLTRYVRNRCQPQEANARPPDPFSDTGPSAHSQASTEHDASQEQGDQDA
jgi:hypothetical protein